MNLYSIFDADMCEFSPVFSVKNDTVALKGFKHDLSMVCEQNVRQHQDIDVSIYSLYQVGYFNPESDENPVVGVKPRFIFSGADFDVSAYQDEVKALKAEDDEVNNG